MQGEQQQLKLSRKLVFTSLPGNFNTEGQSFPVENTIQYRKGNLSLVRM